MGKRQLAREIFAWESLAKDYSSFIESQTWSVSNTFIWGFIIDYKVHSCVGCCEDLMYSRWDSTRASRENMLSMQVDYHEAFMITQSAMMSCRDKRCDVHIHSLLLCAHLACNPGTLSWSLMCLNMFSVEVWALSSMRHFCMAREISQREVCQIANTSQGSCRS